jgi:hypothetical protein
MTERHHHTVQARDRELNFEGELLGSSTSYGEGKPRWSEVQIFRTIDGDYVVAGVGRSTAPGEKDLRWAHVCLTPAAVVEQLHQYDDDKVRYITALSRRAIIDAGERDPELLAAFMSENLTHRGY